MLETKEELVTDLKNLVYRYTDDLEKFGKMLKDADKQLLEMMTQIKDMAEEKDLREKELEELKTAAQTVIDMVDPPEEGTEQNKTIRVSARSSSEDCEVPLGYQPALRVSCTRLGKVLLAEG